MAGRSAQSLANQLGHYAMTTFAWILMSGLGMSLIALAGSVTLLMSEQTLERILLPMVAFAAGTLLGGAFLHMVPGALSVTDEHLSVFLWLLAGFVAFFGLEQFLHWRHGHRRGLAPTVRPVTYLVLVGDALHNFFGGLAVAGAFIADVRLGMTAWLAAAAHEIPQELGDFGILVHGGWKRGRALTYNFLSALTFLVGGVLAYAGSFRFDVSFLLPFAAGNFLYIAASDLVPEVKHSQSLRQNVYHFTALLCGIALLAGLRLVLD